MSETSPASPPSPVARSSARGVEALDQRRWFRWARRIINLMMSLGLGLGLVLWACPRGEFEEGSRLRAVHDDIVEQTRQISLSQTWKMYAPDPGRGHFYMELDAIDVEGTVRELDDSYMATHGWGTAWAWRRSRLDIWQHAATRRIDKVNRNRTWYLRGVCVREARLGHDLRRLEMHRVYRRIRPPKQVRKGKPLLGKLQRRKAQDGSCRVKIIRQMIADDAARREAAGD